MAAINMSSVWVGASGMTYNIDLYIPDSAGSLINWSQDGAAGASTSTFWNAPEPVRLLDLSGPTGTLATAVGLKLFGDDVPTGQTLRVANYLNSLATRPSPGAGFKKGRKISAKTF